MDRQDNQHETASGPEDLPARRWPHVAWRVIQEVGRDRLSVVAAGVGFYSFLAFFPAVAALVLIYGLVADVNDVIAVVDPLRGVVPDVVIDITLDRLTALAQTSNQELGFGLVFSLALAVWSSSKGTKSLLTALNIAYEEPSDRSLLFQNIVGLAFTFGAVIFLTATLALVAAIPALLELVYTGSRVEALLLAVRWPVLVLLLGLAICVLYRWGPKRRPARWRWIWPGAVLSTAGMLAISIGLSVYVQNFSRYDEAFGSAAAVVILLMWLYLAAFAVCVGAELNAELELETEADTTTGDERPRGRRGAWVADHTREDRRPAR